MKNIIKNKNGYMLVEIIVASVITLVMAYFLIDITIKLVDKNNDYYIDSVLLTDKNIITKEIMDDINSKKLVSVVVNDDHTQATLTYDDATTKEIIIDKENKIIKYGNYTKKLSEEVNLEEITLESDNNILVINMPIYTNYSKEDYGIKLTLPYSEDIEIVYSEPPIPPDITLNKLNLKYDCKKTTSGFNSVATKDEGICSTEDDIGTSYYFRGASTNNYVYFANFYWRIIRINGDGSIRMIYDGTNKHQNGENSSSSIKDRRINSNNYNYDNYDNKYVGYMYGTSSGSYSLTHENKYDSKIKEDVESWFYDNIELKGYSNYVSDAIYCNDRTLSYGDGIGDNWTKYGAFDRLWDNRNPSLICKRKEDRFTQSEEFYNGNGKLKYPIGLISADEVAFAGGVSSLNNENTGNPNKYYYLYTGGTYWTMSPTYHLGGLSGVAQVYSTGAINLINGNIGISSSNHSVRPVISLASNIIFEGDGTIDYPFVPIGFE